MGVAWLYPWFRASPGVLCIRGPTRPTIESSRKGHVGRHQEASKNGDWELSHSRVPGAGPSRPEV